MDWGSVASLLKRGNWWVKILVQEKVEADEGVEVVDGRSLVLNWIQKSFLDKEST